MENISDVRSILEKNAEVEKRSIVFCETLFQLFSTLCIFMHYKDHAPVDIVLSDSSDFSRVKPILEKEGPFENVYTLNVKEKIVNLWQGTKAEEREKIALDAGSYLPEIELKHTYTDLWVNLDSMAPKMFYYKLLKYGMQPYLHFVDEGTSSYVIDFSSAENDFIDHNGIYGKNSFTNRISDMWLNEPRLYVGGRKKYPMYQIPNNVLKDEKVKDFMLRIFGTGELPKERYIYFEESFAADSRTTNDLELFLEIANVVGKENIIVKRHPRNPINRFEKLGFKVMEQQNVPWEIMLLTNNIDDKVLISVGSSTTLTPFFLYGMHPKAILLKRLLVGYVPYLANPKMDTLLKRSVTLFNKNSTNLYYPASIKELRLAVEYVNNNPLVLNSDMPLFDDDDGYLYDPFYIDESEVTEEELELSESEQAEHTENSDESGESTADTDTEHGEASEEEDFVSYEEKQAVVQEKLAKLEKPYMSIVVPVYNVEKYLRKCLNSIVFQTIDDIEILVVNDGATDNSQAIIDEYAEKFPDKIVPLYKENGGLSSARKYGFERARGKYVGFVDSDDYIDCNYCKKCLEALLYDDTKAVAFCINHVYSSGTVVRGSQPSDETMESFLLQMAASFYSKVYDREFLKEHVEFLDMWYEDIPVINPMLSYLDKISILKDRLYFYLRNRQDSITNTKRDARQLDCTKAEELAIANINPVYRDYQVARSMSRLATLNINDYVDYIYDFIKLYSEDLAREEVRELIKPNILAKIDKILASDNNIPLCTYVGAFGMDDNTKQSLKEKYSTTVFWNSEEIVFVDESNCDINENEVVSKLYSLGEYDKLNKYFTAKAVYENGGFAINGNFIFGGTMNKFKYSNVFFGFYYEDNICDSIFGAEKGNKLMGDICQKFIEEGGELTIAECAEYFYVGNYSASLKDTTQHFDGADIYDSKTFIYKVDSSNVSIMLDVSEEDGLVIIPTEAYNNQMLFFAENYKLANKTARIQKKSKELTAVNKKYLARITELKGKVYKRNDSIARLKEKDLQRVERINELKGKIAQRVERINELKEKDLKRVERINELKEKNAQKVERINELKQKNAQRVEKIEKLKAKVQSKEQAIKKLEKANLKQANKIDALKDKNSQLKATNKKQTKKIAKLQAKADILKRFSFRVHLKLYRIFTKIFKKGKKK